MSEETKFGFWWTRGGKLACVVERNSDSFYPLKGCVVGFVASVYWGDCGRQYPGQAATELDLVEYIGLTHPGVTERPKSEPKWVPWTFDDQLVGIVVQHKASGMRRLITDQGTAEVYMSRDNVSYEFLLANYVRLDGTPCGKQVTE